VGGGVPRAAAIEVPVARREDGRELEAASRWRDAVETYERAIEVDEVAEELYQRLIVGYDRKGLRAEAVRAYERCRAALLRAFSVEPSPQTESLYRSTRGR
jgi:DNA-binding SARP family transcriptional activator